jgi:N6-adenosine-specific RNA methylase IME4
VVTFAVIIADPPWSYRVGGIQGDVDAQYETMALAEIAALPVQRWAAGDAVLALWTTWPKLDEAMALIAAWGFTYVTGIPWLKTVAATIQRGVGFWTQSASEILLIGRRGDAKRRSPEAVPLGLLAGEDRQFYAPNGRKHSRKPAGIHEWLAAMFDGPYLELFARRPHAGWTTWGRELGFQLSPAGVEYVGAPLEQQPALPALGYEW